MKEYAKLDIMMNKKLINITVFLPKRSEKIERGITNKTFTTPPKAQTRVVS
jgi:hypothetical protein